MSSIQGARYNRNFLFKRLGVFLLDALVVAIVWIGLIFSVGNLSIKAICKKQVSALNEKYVAACEIYNVPYKKEGQYGLYVMDESEVIKYYMNQEGLSAEKAEEKKEELSKQIDTYVSADSNYVSNYKAINLAFKLMEVIAAFIPLFIFQFLIPLCTKKRQTIFMMVFGMSIVRKRDNVLVSGYQVLIRFFIQYIVEFISLFFLLGIFGELITGGLSMVLLLITPSKCSLHDFLSMQKVVYNKDSYTEPYDDGEEKQEEQTVFKAHN